MNYFLTSVCIIHYIYSFDAFNNQSVKLNWSEWIESRRCYIFCVSDHLEQQQDVWPQSRYQERGHVRGDAAGCSWLRNPGLLIVKLRFSEEDY